MAPSMEHEGAVSLFEHRPTLAAELLGLVGGDPAPPYAEARVESGNLTQLDPAAFLADAVVILRDGKGRAVLGMVIEVQRQKAREKPSTWGVYAAVVSQRYGCPVDVLVITHKRAVARWARRPIEVVRGYPFRPVVAGPDELPAIVDVEEAKRSPELAVLSAFAHAGGDDVALAVRAAYAAKKACEHLGGERGLLYWNFVDVVLNEAHARELEALMNSLGEKEYGYFARKYLAQGREEGREEGLLVARRAVERLLTLRFGPLPAAVMERLGAANPETLERISERILSAASIEETLAD